MDKVIFECPYCGNTQDEKNNEDPTSAICLQCGKTYLTTWKEVEKPSTQSYVI